MALEYFLIINGVAGNYSDPISGPLTGPLTGAFQVQDFSLDIENSGSAQDGSGGFNKADFRPLSMTLTGETLAKFWDGAAKGTQFSTASLIARDSATPSVITYSLNLTNALVVHATDAQSNDPGGSFSLSLDYSSIGLVSRDRDINNNLLPPQSAGWDIINVAPTDGGKSIVSSGSGSVLPSVADHYYLSLSEVGSDSIIKGSSQADGHGGWFELSDFDIDIGNLGTSQVANGSGKAGFGALSVTLQDEKAFGLVLKALTLGTYYNVRIEGVSDAPALGKGDHKVYQLTLNDAFINRVVEDNNDGYTLDLAYVKVGLLTKGLDQTGATLVDTGSFGWDVAKNVSIDPSKLAGSFGDGAPDKLPVAPTDYYLIIQGVAGNYTGNGLTGAFRVSSFDFGAENPTTIGTGSGGGGAAKPVYGDLSLSLQGESSTALLAAAAAGTVFKSASLVGMTAGGTPQIVYDVNLANVLVKDVADSKDFGFDLNLDYSRIGIANKLQEVSTGNLVPDGTFAWDILNNKVPTGANIPALVTKGATAVLDTAPTKYFLSINGIDGSSLDTKHKGWFELTDFNLNLDNLGTTKLPNQSGPGKTDFSNLSVSFGDDAALAALLLAEAKGNSISEMRIEGVTAAGGGQASQVVYALTLASAHVSGIADVGGPGYSASFTYEQIGLQTFGLNVNNKAVTTGSFGFDLTTGTAIAPPVTATGPHGSAAAVSGATDYYLIIDGVAGNYSDAALTGAFHVTSYDFGAASAISIVVGGGASGTTKSDGTSFGSLDLTLDGNSYAALMAAAAGGTIFKGATLVGRTAGATPQIVSNLNLADVLVTGVNSDGGGFGLSLDYDHIGLETFHADSKGKLVVDSQFGWDTNAIKDDSSKGTSLVSGNAGTVGSTTPTQYYLAIDGLDGGSNAAGHQHWFDLSAFAFGVGNDGTSKDLGNAHGGPQPGNGTFGALSATINEADLPKLLLDAASGALLTGIRIEGVDSTGVTVYKLTLADVLVTNVGDTADSKSNVGFDYGRIYLETDTASGGSATPTGSFGYDIVNHRFDSDIVPDVEIDHGPGARGDLFHTTETDSFTGNVFDDNGHGVDTGSLTVTAINGVAMNVGQDIMLASGAHLLLKSDGNFFYDPNFSFGFVPDAASGASNPTATDTFTYTLADGTVGTVRVKIDGSDGADMLRGSAGVDHLSGGTSDDTLEGGPGGDFLNGGDGTDFASYEHALAGVTARLDNPSLNTGDAAGDTYTAIEGLIGSNFGDTLAAGPGGSILKGLDGIDTLIGGGGYNQLYGGNGDDILTGGASFDDLHGDGGNDKMTGGGGGDWYWVDSAGDIVIEATGGGTDRVYASVDYTLGKGQEIEELYADSPNGLKLTGNALGQSIYGGNGADTLEGGGGADFLYGGEGNDTYVIKTNGVTIVDTGTSSADTVVSSVANFTLPDNVEWLVLTGTAANGTGNALNNTITGNDGANTLTGGDGKDKILGGGGDDRLNGGLQADTLTGGAGNDTFVYSSVQESMAGTANRDTITDFTTGDRINLVTIDAKTSTAATNEAFSFIGTAAFGHHEGELRYQALGANTLVQGDVNGDGVADLEIVLTGGHVMHGSDFQL